MVAALSVVDSHTGLATTSMNLKSSGDLVLHRNSMKRKIVSRTGVGSSSLELATSFVDSWVDWRVSSKSIWGIVNRSLRRQQCKDRKFVVVNELAGQYEDSFADVKTQLRNYFTYKAVRTVMYQLYEMNPQSYRWFYDFVAENVLPGDGKRFLRRLAKEKQDLAERVMITRLHLYGKWIKKCDHAEIYKEISEENLALMRERLMETVIWPTDDTNTDESYF